MFYLLGSSLIASLSPLLKFGFGLLDLKFLVHSYQNLYYSFNKGVNGMMIFVYCPTIVFICLKHSFLSKVSLLIESLKLVFIFISPKKLFKLLSSSLLCYAFGVGSKFKFLFKSLYSLFEKKMLVN